MMGKVSDQSDVELRKLALDVVKGNVFTSLSLSVEEMPMHFYPVLFGGLDNHIDYLKDNPEAGDAIGCVYEEFHKALPRGLNGKPIFTSCRLLNKRDTEKLRAYIRELEQKEKSFVNEQ